MRGDLMDIGDHFVALALTACQQVRSARDIALIWAAERLGAIGDDTAMACPRGLRAVASEVMTKGDGRA